MAQIHSINSGSVRHEKIKKVNRISANSNLTWKRADIQQNEDNYDSLKYMYIDSRILNYLTQRFQYLKIS